MRAAGLALLALLVGACQLTSADAQTAGDDGSYGVPECATAADCVLAATTCCGCPEFAMPDDGWASGCEDVDCPPPENTCPPVEVQCNDGACQIACAPLQCDLTCQDGFVTDASGCLSCACASGQTGPAQCTVDTDCVEIPADCCGCARGGADTAVPAADAQAMVDSLMCPTDPACPEVDVCDPAAVPRCVAGSCTLGPAAGSDELPGECGTPDLPPCPEGTVCVLNADDAASSQGVGTCQPGA